MLKDFVAKEATEEDNAERMKLNKSVGDQLKHVRATKIEQHVAHMCRALKISAAIVFTSASCNISFSTLSFIKNLL